MSKLTIKIQRGSRVGAGVARLTAIVVLALVFSAVAVAGVDASPAEIDVDAWDGIHSQLEAERHRIVESKRPGRLWRADNPAQRFAAHFGAEDVVLLPRGRGEPAWELGLRLTSWGPANDLQPVQPAGAISEGNRVEYRRGPLTEWYVNNTMGLEQGFTIEAPPSDDINELVLEMTLDGDLTAKLADGAQSVRFRHETTGATLVYSGLAAWDADGEDLDARMELAADEGTKLRLVVSILGAVWPITVDPTFAHVAKLLPRRVELDNASECYFGQRVAVDGDIMIASAHDLEYGEGSGAVHIFQRGSGDTGAWDHIAKINAEDGTSSDNFGGSLAISGDIVIVGADSGDNGDSSGSAYIFQRDHGGPDAWGQVAKLTPSDGEQWNKFGRSVSISGDAAIVGARGSAYVFRPNQGGPDAWGQVAKLTPPVGSEGDRFGHSTSIDGEIVVIGDHHHDSASGSAYVFQRNQGGAAAWGQVAEIKASDGAGGDSFGYSVSIDGDTIVVGAVFDDDSGTDSGSAYVFQRNQGGPDAWGQVAKVTPPDGAADDNFGFTVSIDGETVVAGAPRDNDSGTNSGSAYVFQHDQGGPDVWGEIAKITAVDGAANDVFGNSVTIDSDAVFVGSFKDNANGGDSGSVYFFERDEGGPDAWGLVEKHPCPPLFGARYHQLGGSVSVSGDTAVVGAPEDPLYHLHGLGSAYVFQRDHGGSGAWGEIIRIIPADGADHDGFGSSVSIDGDTIVVGAVYHDGGAWRSGSAYIFQRNQGGPDAWGQVAEINPEDIAQLDHFYRVSIDGDTVVVGASLHDDNGSYSGSAYIFQRNQGGPDAWGQVAKVTPTDGVAFDYFGISVAIFSDTITVGAIGDDDNGSESGSIYIFQRNQGGPDEWGQVAKITPLDGAEDDYFGSSVAIFSDTVIVGAPGDRDNLSDSGSAYIFQRDQGGPDAWGLTGIVRPTDAANTFGRSVAIDDTTGVVGAPESEFLGWESGAAYVYNLNGPLFLDGFETGDTSEWSEPLP